MAKKLKDSAKGIYYQNVKPNIDKVLTNPLTAGLVGGIPGLVGSYFYRPDFDARSAKTQDEAYKMARSTGAKTFIWNGKHYNTDYKGNPKKTLVQQKQEELDIYGITNEQTQNKNLIEQRLHNNLIPIAYNDPFKQVYDAVIKNKKDETYYHNDEGQKIRNDLFGLTLGYPQKNNTVGISNYIPTKSKEKAPYYYKLNKDPDAYSHSADNNGELEIGKNMNNTVGELGVATIGRGKDYYSYYDKWDINPFKGASSNLPEELQKFVPDVSMIGKPLNIYDRKYYNENDTQKSLGGDIMIKKKLNKFVVPQEYNQSAVFAKGGNLYELGGLPTNFKSSAAGQFAAGNVGAGLSGVLGAAPGIMGLANSTIKDFDTSGVGKEVVGTQDMTRNDILNTNVNVDAQQKGFGAIAGDAASAAMAGMQVAGPWGALAGLVPIATGIFGNEAKQNKAEQAEQQWTNNLQAKNRQFNQQDLRQSMANFSANGGYVFADGGSNLPITNNPGELTGYNMFRGTLPSNQAKNGAYDLFTGWKDYGKPIDFSQAQKPQYKDSQPWMTRESDGYHAKSVGYNKQTGNYDFLKDKSHKTIGKELEWYNSKGGSNFKSQYDLDTSGDYYKYTPKKNILEMNRSNQQYAFGGDLNTYAYGGNMPSQLTSFQSGGSHESNPNGGILQGTGVNGKPNLVEEGETKHEDYIFSDRLKINPQISKDFKLPKGLNGKTFADASKYLNREAKDRPNDPISNNAVKAQLAKLTAAQEGLKEQMQPQQQQGIPMEDQPNANILAQGYANGGYIDQTHYQNPTLQGANIGAKGMPLTKLNTPLVGIDQNAYARNMKLQGVDWKANPLSNVKDINVALKEAAAFRERNPYQQEEVQSTDFSRYAPVAANIAMGISDMFENPEVVKYGRVNPERITARMDYQPVDTEWMTNKMNATYAGNRDQMINNSGGNRAIAMAGLGRINQQQQNAVGEAYLKAQDINYNRKNQATQFNAGIEAQNVAAQNAAQQTNLQLQMQEMDANARNRAAKRNAARQAILNAASNIGDIGRENFNANTVKSSTGYGYDANGNIVYNTADGTVFGDSIYKNGKWIKK